MKQHTKNLPPGWYIEGLHLHGADGYSRCVKFNGGLQHERVSLTLKNYGHEDYAALWDSNAAHLMTVLEAISDLAGHNTSPLCQDIKRRADHAISFSMRPSSKAARRHE